MYHHDGMIYLLNRHLLSNDQCINTFLPRRVSYYLSPYYSLLGVRFLNIILRILWRVP